MDQRITDLMETLRKAEMLAYGLENDIRLNRATAEERKKCRSAGTSARKQLATIQAFAPAFQECLDGKREPSKAMTANSEPEKASEPEIAPKPKRSKKAKA